MKIMSTSKFTLFMRANKKERANEKHAVTKSLCDESGKPLEWEFKPLNSKLSDQLRDECTKEIPVPGKTNMYRPKLDSAKYIQKMICASVVYPDLRDAELQDSYGVKTPEDLLYSLVDDPGEYGELAVYVQKMNGFDISLDDKVEEAKN